MYVCMHVFFLLLQMNGFCKGKKSKRRMFAVYKKNGLKAARKRIAVAMPWLSIRRGYPMPSVDKTLSKELVGGFIV